MLGIEDAAHEEETPEAANLFINKLLCSLVGQTQQIRLSPESLTAQIYDTESTEEEYRCNYGLNEAHRAELEQSDLKIVGVDLDGAVQVVELTRHPFFIATLFLPQHSSTFAKPHPLIMAFLRVAGRMEPVFRQVV